MLLAASVGGITLDADIPYDATYHDAQGQRARLREQLDFRDRSPEDLGGELLISQEGVGETRQYLPLSVEDLFVVAHHGPLRLRF